MHFVSTANFFGHFLTLVQTKTAYVALLYSDEFVIISIVYGRHSMYSIILHTAYWITAGHSTKYTCTPNVGKPYLPTNGKQTLEHIINIETVWWLNTPFCLAHNTVTHTHHISRRQNTTMATISPIRPPITPKEAPTATASEWYTNKQPIGVCLTVKHKHTPILMSGGCTLFLAWVGIRLQGLLDNHL